MVRLGLLMLVVDASFNVCVVIVILDFTLDTLNIIIVIITDVVLEIILLVVPDAIVGTIGLLAWSKHHIAFRAFDF